VERLETLLFVTEIVSFTVLTEFRCNIKSFISILSIFLYKCLVGIDQANNIVMLESCLPSLNFSCKSILSLFVEAFENLDTDLVLVVHVYSRPGSTKSAISDLANEFVVVDSATCI
jgi:hypothetical protein